ncbi:hypothetical protein OAA10_00270 [bacterium]|nr:hypothetical protein [bacterium]
MLENLSDQILKTDAELEKLKSLALELGASETNLHLSNVVKIIEKAVREKLDADERAKAAGYKSVLIALKAVGQKTTFIHMPTELTVAPSQWIVPRSISEVRSGSKTLTRTNPAVTATQAQTKLKKLLPLMDEFCSDNNEEGIESLKSAFYSLTYDEFSTELLGLIAESRGRADGQDKKQDKTDGLEPLGLPVGELILSYERLTQRWMKDDSDFQRFVKEATYPMRLQLIEEAAAIDLLNDNANAEVASLLIPTAFFELCDIGLEEVTGYELNHPGELPTSGKDMLHRLRKIGLGASITDYQKAIQGDE